MPASRHSSFTDSTDKLIGLWSSSSDHNQPTNTNQTSTTATTTTTPRWRWRAAATRWIASNAIETKKICFWFSLFFSFVKQTFGSETSFRDICRSRTAAELRYPVASVRFSFFPPTQLLKRRTETRSAFRWNRTFSGTKNLEVGN